MDIGWELKKLGNMKVMVIAIVDGATGTAPTVLEKSLRKLQIKEWTEIFHTTFKIIKTSLMSSIDLLKLAVSQTLVKTDVKNPKGVNFHYYIQYSH